MTRGRVLPALVALGGGVALFLGVAACGGGEDEITLGLITKEEENPFFVTMREVAEDVAGDNDVKLLTAAGKSDVDNASQVAALEDMTLGLGQAVEPGCEKRPDGGRDRQVDRRSLGGSRNRRCVGLTRRSCPRIGRSEPASSAA